MGTPAARITDTTAHGGLVSVGFPTVLIGSLPASRIGDMHTCPMVTGVVPHVGGPFVMGAFTVWTGNVPQSKVGDTLICVGPPDVLVKGEPTVLVATNAGGMGFGMVMAGLMAGLMNFLGGYPRSEIDENGNIVTQYNNQITITGSPEYQAAVVRDLNTFLSTPTGQAWADRYSATGRHITIQPIPPTDQQDNGGTTRVSPNDALVQVAPDGTETPGDGSDSIIDYNPSYTMRYTGEDGNVHEMPPSDVLGHEMIHSLHNGEGTNRRNFPDTQPNGDNQEEAQTIGVHGFEGEDVSERSMSEDAGRSPRPDHDSVAGGTFQDSNGVWHETGTDASGNPTDTIIPAPPDGAPNH